MAKKSNSSSEYKFFETAEEQAIHRSGMWIGSSKPKVKEMSILNDNLFESREVEVIPAVAKLVEELIVNSADEHRRTLDKSFRGWTLNKIDVEVNTNGSIRIWDNGGITSEYHEDAGCYVPELIFGKLFSSSNYDDESNRDTAGTNGVGSSLTNLFSSRFTAVTCDTKNEITVNWSNNMQNKREPIIKKSSKHFTEITATLDLERFEIDEIPYGTIKYIERLCVILAASNKGLEVTFNGETYKFSKFEDYVKMYGYDEIIGESNKEWEFYLTPTNTGESGAYYAIVNGAECNEGTHIRHFEDMTFPYMRDFIDKKLKKDKIKSTPSVIRKNYNVFINIKANNPVYDSQTKTCLTSSVTKDHLRGSAKNLAYSNKTKNLVLKSKIIDNILKYYSSMMNEGDTKEANKLTKELKAKKAKTVKKLNDAEAKGKNERKKCELWIFEGESAGAGFDSGRDPKYQGSYFLKGKVKSTYSMNRLDILKNQELNDIILCTGLDPKDPSNLNNFRFGKIIIATDADPDGDSIFAQLLTFFSIHYPEVINKGLFYRAATPLHRLTKAKDVKYFYSNDEYKKFQNRSTSTGWTHKYFKGLGSLEKKDYESMLKDSMLEKYTVDDNDLDVMGNWMGDDSEPRKKYLENEV